MTVPPPPLRPGYPHEEQYFRAPTSGMAIASMVLGILSLLLAIVLIGVPLGWVALILGIVSLVKINRNPRAHSGLGFAIAGIVTGAMGGVCIAPLLIAILLPSLGKARELSNRSVCAANLKGIAQSLNVYAVDNSDAFPIFAKAPPSSYSGFSPSTTTASSTDEAIKSLFKPGAPSGSADATWVLVLRGDVSPKSFVCKSDLTKPAAVTSGSNIFINFQSEDQLSYSLAYPYDSEENKVGKWWSSTIDASLPIASDMAPMEGTGSPPRALTTLDKRSNSDNHQFDGQNVAFADGHIEFVRLPDCGQDNDNIFTMSGTRKPSRTGIAPVPGNPPAVHTPTIPYDVVMTPIRNLDTRKLW